MATNPPPATRSEWTTDEDQYRSHPHDARRQPRQADRAARHDEGEGERPAVDPALFDHQVTDAVADRVRKQVENGIDIVTDGEMSKVSFLGYVKDRLGGFEVEKGRPRMAPSWQVEIDMFPEYYAEYFKKYSSAVAPLRRIICRGPDQLRRPRPAPDRHRQPQGSDRRPATSPTCSCRRPGRAGSGATSSTRPGRVPRRGRRGDARGVSRRSSTRASSCRSTTRG